MEFFRTYTHALAWYFINFDIYSLNIHILKNIKILEIYKSQEKFVFAKSKLLESKVITKDESIRNSNLIENVW